MEDDFRIDSHKLIFHVARINDWLNAKTIPPIYLEISPSGACNHRCIFCALDYLGYKPKFLDLNVLKATIKQAGALGVKSVMYSGEGEPLLHKDICEIVKYTKDSGIDVAITTNGVLLKKEVSGKILKFLSWIKVSFNAGKSKTYSKVHRCQKEDFHKVLNNLKDAIEIKDRDKLSVAVGVQLLLIPDNFGEVFTLVKLLKNIKVDYLTIKPYSQHPLSGSHIDPRFKYEDYAYLNKKLQKMEDDNFKIIFREQTMRRLSAAKDYKRCLGVPFWAYINAGGDVYACSAFLEKKEFCYGNIYKDNFRDIMNSKRRKAVIRRVSSRLDVTSCRQACRLDKINSYLWELKNPGSHVNFI
ncbi:MAG: radical SAM protein [Candidatus Omnitrophota bacterium]|nr:radical SAM protein [Candidatus Omnitrophota bacterium]